VKKTISILNDPGFEKKDQILDVAEALFSKHGFDGVSIRSLAKQANINIAMVSYYFGSKENLYIAVIERKMVTIRQYLTEAFPNGGNAWDKLYYIIDRYVDRMVDNRSFMNIVFTEVASENREHIVDFLSKRLADNQEAFGGLIVEGIKSAHFREVDPQLAIMSIIGPLKLYVSNPFMVKKMMNENTIEGCYSSVHRDRMKAHLKDLMTRFLKP
jgi:AcrR family transcriptional regulator